MEKVKQALYRIRGIPVEVDLTPYHQVLENINAHNLGAESDDALKGRAAALRRRAAGGEALDALLPECFALVREASGRAVGLRPYDVQVIAGTAMHGGRIAELATGEGKTLAAVFPAALNALAGLGVHVLTFNDYLARRDAAWMGPIYSFLGLSVGCNQEGLSVPDKRRAFARDVTYSTAKEAGFDFLRDEISFDPDLLIHRPFHMAVVDEADSILIDEARVPLVIAGLKSRPRSEAGGLAALVRGMKAGVHYLTDAEMRNVHLSDSGVDFAERALGRGNLYSAGNVDLLTALHCALHAEALLRRDRDYIVRDGRVEIVDEFTGRIVDRRHWPDGLQAAVEAKEGLSKASEGIVLGSITLQHFFELYPRLCGMTATAVSAADEFKEFYRLPLTVVAPHRPCLRKDRSDRVFSTKAAKSEALVGEIRKAHAAGRPVLIGTSSVEESETLSGALKKAGVPCVVLNAKNDEEEAGIVARAGLPGAVTVSTNMAGRGTDIKLGGPDEAEREKVAALGGLYVIGTNRHESLRIDRQLRGRAGRQGDPGSSRFFISLEDDIIVRYGIREALAPFLKRIMASDELNHPILAREIARSQRIIEGQNFEIRKTLRQYSSLVEKQRALIAEWRRAVLLSRDGGDLLSAAAPGLYGEFVQGIGKERLQELERRVVLLEIDSRWSEHLAFLQDLRESIHLVKVGGLSPFEEFLKQATSAFLELETRVRDRGVAAFERLRPKMKDIDLNGEALKGPSSTWTYLINDQGFGWGIEMLSSRNIGFTAAAAGFLGPLFILLGLLKKKKRQSSKDEGSGS